MGKFVTGKCVMTDKKYTEIFTHHSVFKYFTMGAQTFMLCDITDDDFLSLMDNDGEIREDIQLPDSDSIDAELGTTIREGFDNGDEVNITVLTVVIGKDDDAKERTRITNVQISN